MQTRVVLLAGLACLLCANQAQAWVHEGEVYGCSDTMHPDDDDAPEHSWSSIEETGDELALSDDEVSGALPIGFDFDFYGETYTEVFVSSNGYLSFLRTAEDGCCSGEEIPVDDEQNGIIALLWEDLHPASVGGVYYETRGDEGSRSFFIEFNGVPHCCSDSEHITAQIELREEGNEVYLHYLADGDSSGTHTIGIENETGTVGVQIYHGETDEIDLSEQTIRCAPVFYDGDDDGFTVAEGDCDDENAAINPDADEVCDEVDNDCDDEVDEGFDRRRYRDADEDGYGDADVVRESCGDISGYVENGHDCNDARAEMNPDEEEVCDGLDNDCDDEIDEGLGITYYGDFDHDGYGDPDRSTEACEMPAHHVENDDDCDDTVAAISPDADEVCDGIDNDCDDEVDEGLLTTYYMDADRDGHGDPDAATEACTRPARHVESSDDCNDGDRAIRPGAEEFCDGIDNDCDGELDDGAPTSTFYADADGDGRGDPDSSVEACVAPEGYVESSDDCDDTQATVYPLSEELCDELDNNCNGIVDEGVTTTFFMDTDDDGFGDSDSPVESCEIPEGAVENSADCDDDDDEIYPEADESCDEMDNDCDGEIDEDVMETFYLDSDDDGFGDAEFTVEGCVPPTGYVDNAEDCDDVDGAINPDADEACDGIDNDCDGEIDEDVTMNTYYEDSDGDGFGDPDETEEGCTAPTDYVDNDDDCDDSDDTVYPDAFEEPDGQDNDCDGEIDEGLYDGGADADADADPSGEEERGCNCRTAGQGAMSNRSTGLRAFLTLVITFLLS